MQLVRGFYGENMVNIITRMVSMEIEWKNWRVLFLW